MIFSNIYHKYALAKCNVWDDDTREWWTIAASEYKYKIKQIITIRCPHSYINFYEDVDEFVSVTGEEKK